MARVRSFVVALLGFFLICLFASSPAFAQTATIVPYVSVVAQPGHQVFVTVTWCDANYSYDLYARTIKLNGTDITSQFTATWNSAACGSSAEPADNFFYVDTATITLDSTVLSHHLVADDEFYGVGGILHQLWAEAYYYMPDPRRGIAVTAETQFRNVLPSTSGLKARFALTNVGYAADTVAVSKTCTGFASSCTLGSSSIVIAAGATAYDTVTFSSSGTTNDTATVRLAGTTALPTYIDSSWTMLTVKPAAGSGVVVVGASPGVNNYVARDLCVTIAVAENGAAECGDLRLAHPLPAITTLGQARVPTLLYNSQHARPKPIIQADVTLPTSWGTLPTTIRACMTVNSVLRGCTSYAASGWGTLGTTRRLAVPADTDNGTWSSDLYSYTLQITTNRGDSPLSTTGEFPVVNRQGSGLGGGWWLAGLEQLISVSSSRLMVIGGDGTVRVYSSAGTNTYTANNPTHPDTLTGSGSSFTRHAPNGALVHFTSGQHDWTRSALGDTTKFTYSGSSLATLVIPTRSGSVTYSFSGISSGVQTITAPGSRTVTIRSSSVTGGARVDSIADPDGTKWRFYSSTGVNQVFRVDSLKNRRGKTTRFTYDPGNRLAAALQPTGYADTLGISESRALNSAQDPDSVYTSLNGPRTDVSDVTRFWINGYGAPTRIRNAAGGETSITYDATWGGLASEVISPARLRSTSHYTSRGLPDTVRVFNPLGDGSTATTVYAWDPVWNHPTQVTSPTGLISKDSLKTDYPLLAWRQVGANSARRDTFLYDSHRQLVRFSPPVVPSESLTYDTLGNVNWSRTSLHLVSTFTRDGLGRVTLAVNPHGDTSRTWYGVMDRVDSTLSKGDSVPVSETGHGHHADSIMVINLFDAEGNDTTATRRFRFQGTLTSLVTHYFYDDGNRLTGEQRPGGGTISYSLDPAGNRTNIASPRSLYVLVTYDALNRPTRRIVPQASYSSANCILYYSCFYTFPTRDGTDHCIGADTAFFSYDAAGNLRRADNGWALVSRGYAPDGALTDETLSIRTFDTHSYYPCGGGDRHGAGGSHYVNDFTHVYASRMTYDLDGRRVRLYHPDGIDFCQYGQCSQKYVYDDTTGALSQLVVEKPSETPDTARFSYDLLGRLIVTRHLSGVSDTSAYDDDSRLTSRRGPFSAVDSMVRDVLGRLASAREGASGDTVATFHYGPLGALVYSSNTAQGTGYEQFDPDAIGDRTWQQDYSARSNWPSWTDRQKTLYFDASSIRLDSIRWTGSSVPTGLTGVNGLNYWATYDAAGNVQHTAAWEPYYSGGWYLHLNEAVNYYDAEDRLQATNRGIDLSGTGSGSTYEEYRYDALGRRVLVRSRCTMSGGTDPMCSGYIERTVWDGDQVLYEIRSLASDTTSSITMESDAYSGNPAYNFEYMLGQVGYVHAGGIDQPLGVYRMGYPSSGVQGLVPHPDFLGAFSIGSMISPHKGYSTLSCPISYTDCPNVTWPGGNSTVDGQLTGGAAFTTWYGNLLSSKTDGSRLQYMRNRYYDPQTGRFTQQDPIGLAGGLNSYGFGGGDPANFSDPFGLCPKELTGRPCLGPVNGATVTPTSIRSDVPSGFGFGRINATRVHQGIDLNADPGTSVTAADEGTVFWEGSDGDLGNTIILAHTNAAGNIVSYTSYSHLQAVPGFDVGAHIDAGQAIGATGTSGNAAGEPPHLHFEIRTRPFPGRGLGGRCDPQRAFSGLDACGVVGLYEPASFKPDPTKPRS